MTDRVRYPPSNLDLALLPYHVLLGDVPSQKATIASNDASSRPLQPRSVIANRTVA
jgi:hypothetical protein